MREYESTNSLVSERFDLAETYANEAIANAESYASTLTSLLGELDTNLGSTEITFDAVKSIEVYAPEFASSIGALDIQLDSSPVLSGLSEVTINDIDTPNKNFNFSSTYYSAPSITYSNAPTEPSIASITFDPTPDFDYPDAPTIDDIIIPAKPNINLGNFDAEVPDLTEIPEPGTFNFTEGNYNSDIRVALFGKILTDIANGGTGLSVDVEADIYARGVERQRVENERLYQEVQNQFSASGIELPSGAYAARLLEVSNEISRKNDQINREITINQAELEQKNIQFSVQQAVVLEQMLVGFFNDQQNRSLQASQTLASIGIEIYNALVARQNLYLEKYKVEAEVFKTKIEAELTAVEMYRTEIEAVKATADIQTARANIYNIQMNALDIKAKIYATLIETAKAKATIEALKVDLFKVQTDAYSANIGAQKLMIDSYVAKLESEKIKADIFNSEISAYATEIETYKVRAEIARIQAETEIQKNNQLIEAYKADLGKYEVDLQAQIANADLIVKGYDIETKSYVANLQAKETELKAQIANTEAQVQLSVAGVNSSIAVLESNTKSYVALKELQVAGTQGIMNVHAQLAASAMNAVNASASQSHDYNDTTSESSSINETHSYNEKCC